MERTVDGPALPIVEISGDPSATPGIACTWRKCLVAWSDFGDPRRIRGVLVKPHDTGVHTQELTIASDTLAFSSYGVPVAWSDHRFLVAWSDARFGDTTPKLLATRVTSDEPPFQVILGTRVKSDGTRLDDPALRISHSPSVEGATLTPAAR